MDIQKQVAFEKFHARECNCDYEDLKRRLDRYELLTGHRYPPTSPRHEAWLTWCAAWDARAQAVPEGFVLVPNESLKVALFWMNEDIDPWQMGGDSFADLFEHKPILEKVLIEAQEQGHV